MFKVLYLFSDIYSKFVKSLYLNQNKVGYLKYKFSFPLIEN